MPCCPKHTGLSAFSSSSTTRISLYTVLILLKCYDISVVVYGFNSAPPPTQQALRIIKSQHNYKSSTIVHRGRGGGAAVSSSLSISKFPITRRVGWPSSIPPPRGSLVSTFAEQEDEYPFTTTTTTAVQASTTTPSSPSLTTTPAIITTPQKSWWKRIKKPFLTISTTIALTTWIRQCILRGTFLTLKSKFLSEWKTYTCIPFVAAFVGWFTNYLAVKMIFYPIQYRGLNVKRFKDNPLGLFGWQGIVPTKTKKMSEAMVKMVTEQLLSVEEVFGRLEPKEIARLLSPDMPKLAYSVALEHFPEIAPRLSPTSLANLPRWAIDKVNKFCNDFLISFTKDMQKSITSILNVRNCVVEQMLADRSLLGKLFQKCGEKELQFLTDSGLWFGFLLGLIQMGIALISDNPWTISIGGLIVGFATNWLALKWIFEPVDPKKVGPFTLQGLFLRRQKEASADFSNFFANNVLTSKKMWNCILTDESTLPEFRNLFTRQLSKFLKLEVFGKTFTPGETKFQQSAGTATTELGGYVGVLHDYVDEKLELEDTFRTRMEAMTSRQFERVLHPIFEEDEATLILSGAALGFVAGFIQQGFSTGKLALPSLAVLRFWTKIPFFS